MKILIVGAGPAGIACALTLAAAQSMANSPFSDLQVQMIDEGSSDLLAAELWEVPGIRLGMSGSELLAKMKAQLDQFHIPLHIGSVNQVSGTVGAFQIETTTGILFEADQVVLATGFKKFSLTVEGGVSVIPHPASPKPRVCLALNDDKMVAPGIYAAGLITGVYSMLAIAAGSGTEVACRILTQLSGGPVVVHDVPGSRKITT